MLRKISNNNMLEKETKREEGLKVLIFDVNFEDQSFNIMKSLIHLNLFITIN